MENKEIFQKVNKINQEALIDKTQAKKIICMSHDKLPIVNIL